MKTIPEDLTLPAALAELAEIGFEFKWDDETDETRGCDFEPYEQFEEPEETLEWLRLWTGNDELDDMQFLFFGSTGAGDYVGFWLVRPNAVITEQPVIYIGSEGATGVVTQDLGDLLWLFANGSGPAEAFDDPGRETQQNEEFRVIAERHAAGKSRSTADIVANAREKYPEFSEFMRAMCL
ncbi:hypothetical protein BJX96DRAFT_147259 [Aspergillus floccosus]